MKISRIFLIYTFLWFAINLSFLADYPAMHTDEPWLSGLTRQMMETGELAQTEPFYDLYERHPHALKILFHICQMPFIKLLGYSLFSVRLLSLLGGLVTLLLMSSLVRLILPPSLSQKKADTLSYGIPFCLSLDIQFIYASHLARQEIIMVAILVASFVILLRTSSKIGKERIGQDIIGQGHKVVVKSFWLRGILGGEVLNKYPWLRGFLAGGLLGLSLGFHPNAFLIAWPAALFILYEIVRKRRRPIEGALFLISCLLGALIFTGLSFSFNSNFLADYLSYGKPLGVVDNPDVKILKWPLFYKKLFLQRGGTYYLPPIKWQLVSLPLLALGSLFSRGRKAPVFTGLLGINLGILLLGKYSQPSIILLLPFSYLALTLTLSAIWECDLLDRWKHSKPTTLIALMGTLLFLGVSISTVKELTKELNGTRESYSEYLESVSILLPQDSLVLGPLSLEFYLESGHLWHWRNLPHTDSVSHYLTEREIEYVVIPGEIPHIYETRPMWNTLYGNTAYWYPQLEKILSERGVLLGEFDSPGYGIRIIAYRYVRPWPVKIYRLNPEDSSTE